MADYNPEFQHADGTPKTYEERVAFRAAQSRSRDIIHREVSEATKTDAPHYSESYLEYAQEQLDRAVLPAERAAARRRLAMAKRAAKEHADEVAVEQRKTKLSNHASVKLAREHAESFARTPPPGADPVDVQTAIALATSEDWHDPDALAEAYWVRVSAIEEAALKRVEAEATEASEAAAKAAMQSAQADLARAKAEQRANQARGHLNDE